jgi:hypothetical protein
MLYGSLNRRIKLFMHPILWRPSEEYNVTDASMRHAIKNNVCSWIKYHLHIVRVIARSAEYRIIELGELSLSNVELFGNVPSDISVRRDGFQLGAGRSFKNA